MSDCVYCALNSEEGKEFLEKKKLEFDPEKEWFTLKAEPDEDGIVLVTAAISLLDVIVNVVKEDKSYFSEEEKPKVIKEILKMIGEIQ